MSVMDFVVSPPGCGRSVTDFWGWDAHEAQLRCPDEVVGDIWTWSTRRGLKPKFNELTRPWSPWGSSPIREKSHGRGGNRNRDLMISSQKRWPLDHEAGLFPKNITWHNSLIVIHFTSELSIISDFILCSAETFNRLIHSVSHYINFQCAVDTCSHSFSHELHSSQLRVPFYSSLPHPFIPLSQLYLLFKL
jgi:hypothetical protein